jgi:endogenous inhibitor of DNA gyrase (YacG/DUF329 family)
MTLNIEKIAVPTDSEISKTLNGSYYCDSYSFCSKKTNRVALQIWLDHASRIPAWVNFLMASRNKIVSMFGLKNLGGLGDLDVNKPVDDYKVGDRVGIFTLEFLSDHEIVLGDSDKHLDVNVSVYIENPNNVVSISTVVHVHNFLGKFYMFFVKPMHKLIVPSSIKRGERHNT